MQLTWSKIHTLLLTLQKLCCLLLSSRELVSGAPRDIKIYPRTKWCRAVHTVGPLHLWTPSQGLKTAHVSIEKNPHVSGPMSFKGQLYIMNIFSHH